MKNSLIKLLSLATFLMVFSTPLHPEIKPPNYDFTLALIEPFFPGKSITDIHKDKTIKSDIFEDNGNAKIIRFKLKRANYSLDIYTQVKDDKISDVFVRLPQYFIHDLFLTDLVKRYKKQDKFIRHDMSALYVWMNRDGNNILYHGSCSITCFPMFVEVVNKDPKVIPLYQKFNEALPKW
ncbi:MAG: hypothetical protein H7177_02390 [Rhizobacter sp.]|nr:hypothetical protein [Bacteriovorax sp.]